MHEGLAGKSACGIFGVLRLEASPKIHSGTVLTAIESVRYRGSNLGAGFAAFDASDKLDGAFAMKIFVDGPRTMDEVRGFLREAGKDVSIRKESQLDSSPDRKFAAWTLMVDAGGPDAVFEVANGINERWWRNGDMKARVFSLGRYLDVYKEVGYPADVARLSGFDGKAIAGDLWLAHTRQPTNSPGRYPVWSHPFASLDCAIVHNGDISSYGANMRFLMGRNARSFVGTDSEVIAFLLDHLIRVKRLSILDAAEVLINPYEHKSPYRGDEGEERRFQKLMLTLRGAQLDGPFTVVAGYADGDDVYLLSLIDRSRFRPIVVGQDEHNIYVASEEAEIRAISTHATVWTPQPGSIVLASMKRGFIQTGREVRIDSFDYSAHIGSMMAPDGSLNVFDASPLDHSQLNIQILNAFQRGAREVHVKNVNGHRCLGVNVPAGRRLIIHGTPGNCLANYNEGAEIIVYGNAADDVADTMHAGRVVIHGDARDVLGQALQGGEVFVRGSVGNRGGIQMREYHGSKPYLIVGGRADDYFGEYMAGGVAMILGLRSLEKGIENQLVGDFTATGIVGGRIYVRGRVKETSIGLLPPRVDVMNYLKSLVDDGSLDVATFGKILGKPLTPPVLKATLSPAAFNRVRRLFEGKYNRHPHVEFRHLGEEDLRLVEGVLERFFHEFHLDSGLHSALLDSKFTVITPVERSTGVGEEYAEE